MDDDLNTAAALAAVFEYIRDTNSTMDAGGFRKGDVASAQDVMQRFDSVFDVLHPGEQAGGIPDAEIEALIEERIQAKKSRNFARADQIRAGLVERGIVLEDTKEGTRWKRK